MRVVSFFAGCGGLDLGFEQAGFNVIWANEFEPHCRATYIRNHPGTKFVLGDIYKLDADSIPDCDGFIGGPPCQSWSVGGKMKGLDDKRGQLFLKYIDLIKAKQPKFFVIENVKGILDDKFKEVFEDFIVRLESAGYDVQWSLLDAVNFRIPQNRERVFFVGFQKELDVTYKFPSPTCTEPITLERAIGDISEVPNRFSGNKTKDTDVVSKVSNPPNHDVLMSKFGSFYYRGNRRRGWQQPSFTINATADFAPLHPSSPKMMYFGHERWNFQKNKMDEYRRLSVRECARIQTFPDNFIFEYNDIKAAYKMIGNAVPPRLGNEIAKSIVCALRGINLSNYTSKQPTPHTSVPILVGYYKGYRHKQLILKNRLYYVRSDGRPGSMFKEDCSTIPQYLLMHNKSDAEFYELESEDPILADASILKTLGFPTSGEKYLCFRLKDTKPKKLDKPKFASSQYAPFFTTLEELARNEIKIRIRKRNNNMNIDSEQVQFDASVIVAQDQPLTPNGIYDAFGRWLGHQNVSKQNILGKKVIVYQEGNTKIVLLTKCITYLGNPHPIFKKRIQLPEWYQDFCIDVERNHLDYDVRFIGVYHYDGNIVFVDFVKETYMQHGLHNSSAHVYTNDLFQAMTYGIFRKEDKLGNTIVAVRNNKMKEYLDGTMQAQNTLFDLFRQFNCGYPFGKWLYAFDIIREMHNGEWSQWRQAEWAGWFLEFEFDKFTREHNIQAQMRYVGCSNKREEDLDFDIRFEEADFYGDLKASDIKKNETPGNDQESLVECIYRYNKFWYVIYEHETRKDSDYKYEATKARNHYIKSIDPSYDKDDMSYHQRMKHSVKFIKMTIIELNKANFRDALKTFNQGKQPDGSARAPKFNIDKKTLANDNFVVFRYSYI